MLTIRFLDAKGKEKVNEFTIGGTPAEIPLEANVRLVAVSGVEKKLVYKYMGIPVPRAKTAYLVGPWAQMVALNLPGVVARLSPGEVQYLINKAKGPQQPVSLANEDEDDEEKDSDD